MSLVSLIRPRPMPYGGRPVQGASRRCCLNVSGSDFRTSLAESSSSTGAEQARVAVNPETNAITLLSNGAKAPAGSQVLPLKYGPLSNALATIEDRQEWLMGGEPIFKTEANGNARIDFLNRGGFVFNQKGEYVSHSVNAW